MDALAAVTEVTNRPETPFQEFAQGRYENDLMRAINDGALAREDVERFMEKSALATYMESRRDALEAEFRALLAMDEVFEAEALELNDDVVQAEYARAMERAEQLKEESAAEAPAGIVRRAALPACCLLRCDGRPPTAVRLHARGGQMRTVRIVRMCAHRARFAGARGASRAGYGAAVVAE